MIWFKTCSRCEHGDMILERDMDGESKYCMQCGHREYLAPVRVVGRSAPARSIDPIPTQELQQISA